MSRCLCCYNKGKNVYSFGLGCLSPTDRVPGSRLGLDLRTGGVRVRRDKCELSSPFPILCLVYYVLLVLSSPSSVHLYSYYFYLLLTRNLRCL